MVFSFLTARCFEATKLSTSQRLKPLWFRLLYGTAEAVPYKDVLLPGE